MQRRLLALPGTKRTRSSFDTIAQGRRHSICVEAGQRLALTAELPLLSLAKQHFVDAFRENACQHVDRTDPKELRTLAKVRSLCVK